MTLNFEETTVNCFILNVRHTEFQMGEIKKKINNSMIYDTANSTIKHKPFF